MCGKKLCALETEETIISDAQHSVVVDRAFFESSYARCESRFVVNKAKRSDIFLFPMLVIREVTLVDLVGVIHNRRKTPHDLLSLGGPTGSRPQHTLQQKSKGIATHAAQTKPAATKP